MSRRSVEDWRRAVYRSGTLTDRTRVLLLLLADHMRTDLRVSVPRKKLAAQLGKTERRISERITEAHTAGYLFTMQSGYRGRTAVYRATFPDVDSGRTPRPLSRTESGTPTSPLSSAETRPLSKRERGRDGCPPIHRADLTETTHGRDVGSNEQTEDPQVRYRPAVPAEPECEYHPWQTCPGDCRNHPQNREATS